MRPASRARSRANLSGLDFACVCVLGQFGDAQMVVVAGLILHVGEDAAGVLAKDGVEGDERLEHGAPFELVQAPHAVEDRGERRLLDGREIACLEGLLGAIEDVLQLRELESLRQDGDLFEQERVALLRLLNVDGERFGRPDAVSCGEISFGQVNDARQLLIALDADVGKRGEGGIGVVSGDQGRLEHAGAFEQLELRRELLEGGRLAAGAQNLGESFFQPGESQRQSVCVLCRPAPSPIACSVPRHAPATLHRRRRAFQASRWSAAPTPGQSAAEPVLKRLDPLKAVP